MLLGIRMGAKVSLGNKKMTAGQKKVLILENKQFKIVEYFHLISL